MQYRLGLAVSIALALAGCDASPEVDAGAPVDSALVDVDAARDAAPPPPPDAAMEDAGPTEADAGPPGACAAPFRPMRAYDGSAAVTGDGFLGWARSEWNETHSVSHGRAVRVRVDPGEEPLPACSGRHFFAGRSRLPAPVPQGHTIWFRMYQYIPSTFSFGYKYSRGAGDEPEASMCGRSPDGNLWLKWLVLAPQPMYGTARIYLMPTAARRALAHERPQVRIISEARHRAHDAPVDLPRDRWFSLQISVYVSDGEDGVIRAWIDDQFLGEVHGRTTVEGAALGEWGMGDYWNGVPWTDFEPGRTDFWVDEIVVASDAEGYDPPTGVDPEGRTYIAPCTRVADLAE